MSEVEKALEEIAEEVAAEDTVENDKKKVENSKAVEMKNRALESLGRQRNEEEENAKQKQKSRRSGGDTIAYFCEKMFLFRSGKRTNCSCKSNELKLRVNGNISQENNIRI